MIQCNGGKSWATSDGALCLFLLLDYLSNGGRLPFIVFLVVCRILRGWWAITPAPIFLALESPRSSLAPHSLGGFFVAVVLDFGR
jgi:hypothetical protein